MAVAKMQARAARVGAGAAVAAPARVVAGARRAAPAAAALRRAAGPAARPLGFAPAVLSGARAADLLLAEAKRSVGDLGSGDLKGKRVFVRADLNVPLDGEGNITDDTRIRAAVPTVKYLVENGAKVLLTSHLGRPKDGPEDKFRLNPVVPRLSELLGMPVGKTDDCVGPEVEAAVAAAAEGSVTVLENVRFYSEETKNGADFAEKLAANADLFVNDAFGTAHRAHASTEGVTKFLSPSVAGFLLQKELDYLEGAVAEPKRPFAAIVGGSKVPERGRASRTHSLPPSNPPL